MAIDGLAITSLRCVSPSILPIYKESPAIRHLFHLDPRSEQSLQKQIVEQIVSAIARGSLPTGKPLPPSRTLATQLGVARNTVSLAYAALKDDGYLISKERSGFYVNPEAVDMGVKPGSRNGRRNGSGRGGPGRGGALRVRPPLDWHGKLLRYPSAQRMIKKPADWQNYPYPFIYGQVDYSIFPSHQWRECCRDAASVSATKDWASDHFERDDDMLIAQIQQHLLPRRGVWAQPGQIMITVGAQQALYMLVRLFLDGETTFGIEDPGYVDIRNIAELNDVKTRALPVDEHGLIISDEVASCDYLYVTPSHQSPTTVTMPLKRRYQLLDLASEQDLVIIEDDYESEISFKSEPTPALKSLDKEDRVIYVGSLSKTLAPGLRIGYVVAPENVITELRALRRLILRHPAANNQRSAAIFMARGHYDALRRNLVKAYKARCAVMSDALTKYLPESAHVPHGGSSFWIKGDAGLDSRVLSLEAAKHGILIEPGDIHFHSSNPPRNFFRLGYSSIPQRQIEPGIKRLSEIIHKLA